MKLALFCTCKPRAKVYYDSKHKPLTLADGDQVFLRLHRGYSVPCQTNRKLSQQRIGPFKILKQIGRLAYRLDLPSHWRVHPVISVAQLEPAPSGTDPYNRPYPDHPETVRVDGDTDDWQSFEVGKILGHRTTRGRKEFLIRWKGWGPEFDHWYDEDLLENAQEVVSDYLKTAGDDRTKVEIVVTTDSVVRPGRRDIMLANTVGRYMQTVNH